MVTIEQSAANNAVLQSKRQSMTHQSRDLTGAQWAILDTLIPKPAPRRDRRGRPLGRRSRVLSFLPDLPRTISAMRSLRSDERSSGSDCPRSQIRGGLDVQEAFIDGSFAPAKKGALKSGKRNAARARKSWQSRTATVFPCRMR